MIGIVSCTQSQVKINRHGFHTNTRLPKPYKRDVSCGVALLLKQNKSLSTLFQDEHSQFIRLTEMPLNEEQMDFKSLPEMTKVYKELKWEDKYEIPAVNLGNGQTAIIVEDICQVDSAIKMLENSMKDNLISLEFEWRSDPIFTSKTTMHQIALLTVGSQNLCVLFRINKLNYEIPLQLIEFLQGRPLMIGLSNRYEQDETRFEHTFGTNFTELLGQNQGSCLDLAILLTIMGYKKYSFRQVAEKLFGAPRVVKNVKRSDWEAFELSKVQIFSAALDVFIQGYMLRELRRRYNAQEACPTCGKIFGIRIYKDDYLKCKDCGKEFLFLDGYFDHCLRLGHQMDLNRKNPVCETCERYNIAGVEDLYDFYESTLIINNNNGLV